MKGKSWQTTNINGHDTKWRKMIKMEVHVRKEMEMRGYELILKKWTWKETKGNDGCWKGSFERWKKMEGNGRKYNEMKRYEKKWTEKIGNARYLITWTKWADMRRNALEWRDICTTLNNTYWTTKDIYNKNKKHIKEIKEIRWTYCIFL